MSKKKRIVLVIAVLLVIGLGVGAFLYLRKKDEETAATTAPVAGALPVSSAPVAPLTMEQQVKQLYRELLGREADASGLAYWTAIGTEQGIEVVRNNFYNSAEYRARVA